MASIPKTSVIIASHRPDMVGRLLDSLMLQECGEATFEVIIVTDYPGGRLPHDYPGYRWLYIADTGIGVKRNAGARIARGGYLAFIDDDCIAMADWIAGGTAYLDSHPATAAVEGFTSIASSPALAPAATREYRRLEQPGYRTNNLFMRKEAFDRAGGFDERFTVQREDIDLCFTLMEQGGTIDFRSDIRVVHRFRPGERWDLLKNCVNRRFELLLFTKHPENYLKHAGCPLPPTQALTLLLHALWVFMPGRRRMRLAVVAADIALLSLLGLRRTGIRAFSVAHWAIQALQCGIAPLVTLWALFSGAILAWKHWNSRERGNNPS